MAANEAEVDLIVNAAGALPDLERQLSQIVRVAENGAPEVDVQASLAVQNSIAVMSTQLDQVLRRVDASDPSIDVEAALDAQASLRNLRQDLDELTRAAARGTTDIIDLEAQLDFPSSLAEVTAAVNDLVTDVQAAAPEIDVEVDVDTDEVPRAERVLRALGRTSIVTAKGLGTVTKSVASLSLAVGGGANAVAGLVAALQQVGPAAAVATQAMVAQKLVAGTLKLAMAGVQDAIQDAFDPSISPDDFHKSLEKLAPEARLFVDELHTMRRELKAVQQGVQNRVFSGLDDVLRRLGRQTGPAVTSALNATASSLNRMARNTAEAAGVLGDSGILGQALRGATKGLQNLEAIPGRLTLSFGLLSAAAAPAFDRITRAVDQLALKVQTKLQAAFESGALERSINDAIDTLAQLGQVLGNFASGVRNIFSGLTQDGAGLFDSLEKLSQAFEDLTASREFQTILNELVLTAGVLIDNILPLIQEAFVQLAPVIQELAPVVRDFVAAIGPELIPIIQQLGPILIDIALILKDQLPLAIDLTNAALDALSVALTIVKGAMDIAKKGSEAFVNFLNSDFARAMGASSKAAVANAGLIQSKFIEWSASAVRSVSTVNNALAEFSTSLRDRFVAAFVSAAANTIQSVKNFVAEFVNIIANLPARAYEIGVNIMSGLAGGLTSGIGRVLSIARGIADSVSSTIKDALDIRSPSRVLFGIGQDTVDGFVLGIKDKFAAVGDAMSDLGAQTTLAGTFSARSGFKSIALPALQAAPAVTNVYVGNEFLARYVDGRVQAVDTRSRRVLSQGVRY